MRGISHEEVMARRIAKMDQETERIYKRIERKRAQVAKFEARKRTWLARAAQAWRPTAKDARAFCMMLANGAVTAGKLSRDLGIKERTLQEWAQKGLIPSIPYGKQRRFLVDAVRAAVAIVVINGRQHNLKGSARAQQRAMRADERASNATHRVCGTCRLSYPLSTYTPSARKRGGFVCNDCSSPYKRATDARRRSSIELTQVEHVSTLKVAKRDGWTCSICHEPVSRSTWSIDHVIPLSKGGPHTYDNVRLAHRLCNSIKGNRVPIDV
jgi:hypothetical protein